MIDDVNIGQPADEQRATSAPVNAELGVNAARRP